ncbi:MAG: NUDIX hydrolase [Phycisphaerales bacterium]
MSGDQSTRGERLIHRGRKFDFAVVRQTTRDGGVVEREIVRHPGAVIVIPLLEHGGLVMVRQPRAAIGERLVEFPAGTLEPGEDAGACAPRELREETGYRAATLLPVGRFYTSPGMSDELMHAFVASGLTLIGQDQEDDEDIEVLTVTPSQAHMLFGEQGLLDGKSLAALWLAVRAGVLPRLWLEPLGNG